MNGKRNGKGKKFYRNDKLRFEGKYLNGRKWNGKGYNINSNMEYEIKGGNGYIKEYYDNGNLKYEGVYFSGEIIYVQ